MKSNLNISVLIMQPWLNYRGAESVSIDLCNSLSELGITSAILCLYISDATKKSINPSFVLLPPVWVQKVVRFKIVFLLFGFWILLFYGIYYGKKFTHYNAHNFPSVWVAVILKVIYGARVIWTVHNFPQHPFHGVVQAIYEFVISPLDFFLVSHVDHICTVSKKVAQIVHQKYHKESSVIYPGIDIVFWGTGNSAITNQFSFDINTPFLLHVGQIRPEKMQHYTLELFSRIYKKCPSLLLVFAGEEIEGKKYLRMQEYSSSVSSRVYLTGRLNKEALRTLYSRAWMIIGPSFISEGCTLSPLEGIASGVKNVFVAKGCGVDELLQPLHSCDIFDPDDNLDTVAENIVQRYFSQAHSDYFDVLNCVSRERYVQLFLDLYIR